MKQAAIILAAMALGLTACGTSATHPLSAQRSSVPAAQPPATSPPPQPTPVPAPNVTDPWVVVSAYYGDVESGNYPEAWALLSSGMVTGQSYQQFVAGYACTGAEALTEVSE